MKNLKSSVYLLAMAWLVCMFIIPSSALAQDGDPPPCCHWDVIRMIPFVDSAVIQTDIYLIDTTGDSLPTDPYSNPTTATIADSTTTQSTTAGSSAELTATEASRKPSSRLKSGDTGRTKRSGHATD